MTSIKKWFRGLRGKLLIMVVLPVIIMAGSTIIGLSALKEQNESAQLVAKDRVPKITTLLRLRINAESAVRFLWASTGFEDPAIRKAKSEQSRLKFKEFSNEYNTFMSFKKHDEKIQMMMKTMIEEWQKVENYSDQATEHLLKGRESSDVEAKAIIENKLIPIYLKQIEVISQTEKALQSQVDAAVLESDNSTHRTQTILIFIGIISTIALVLIGFIIASHLANSLSKVTTEVHSAGSQVEMAGEQLSTASQSLSSGATESASALEETVASLEELSSIVKMNADNAKEAASLSQQSTRSAEDGETEIKTLISAMAEISDSSKKIEEIINVIDDIAFQTNLLALNAAVEAARAGEQGKGFAVVAEAVRNLAQRSASAAKDINTLIKDSVSKTDRGAKIADQSGAVLKNIVSSIKKVSDLNSEIASASMEQAKGISQISKAMNELDSSTQTNAASAEEVAASSEELSAQSMSLQSLVGALKQVIDGSEELQKTVLENYDISSKKIQKMQPKLKVLSGGKVQSGNRKKKTNSEEAIPFEDSNMFEKKLGTTDEF